MRYYRIETIPGLSQVMCALCLLLLGCSPTIRRVPATGTIELDGRPMEGGILMFDPDVSKGNAARVSCTSGVKNGYFELQTAGVMQSDTGTGIPPGWYKVYIRANLPGMMPAFPGQPVLDIDPKYLDPVKTPLEIEIVENPGPDSYRLKVNKKPKKA